MSEAYGRNVVTCPNCGLEIGATERHVEGQEVYCLKCGKIFVISSIEMVKWIETRSVE